MTQPVLFGIALILIFIPLLVLSSPNVRFLYYKFVSANVDEVFNRVVNYHSRHHNRRFSIYILIGPKTRICMWTIGFTIMTGLAANSIFDLNLFK